MTDFRIIEETESGWQMAVRVQDMYWNDDGQFVSREDYVAERDGTEIVTDGYGIGEYGEREYGE